MRRRTTPILLLALGLAATGVLATGSPAFASDRSTIAGSHPAWATGSTRVGRADPTEKISFRVYLKLRDSAGAEAAAQAIATPGSATYRQYLSADTVRDRYAPTAASVSAVPSWLGTAGVKIGHVPSNDLFLQATRPLAPAPPAFG